LLSGWASRTGNGRGPAARQLAIDIADAGPGFSGDPEDVFTRRANTTDGHGIGLAARAR
jgi:hypothetical protein